MEREGLLALIIVILLCAALAGSVFVCEASHGRGLPDRIACNILIQMVGPCSLSLSPECSGARNMTDGICGMMSDIPAGYCCHRQCDSAGPPYLPERYLYRMRVLRTGQ